MVAHILIRSPAGIFLVVGLLLCALTLDLALSRYSREVFYGHTEPSFWESQDELVVTDPHESIPAPIPGPGAQWGGSESKKVVVTISIPPPYRLVLQFPNSHESNPPLLSLRLGSKGPMRIQLPRGSGSHPRQWRNDAIPFRYQLEVGTRDVQDGPHNLILETIGGSWTVIGSITAEPLTSVWRYVTYLIVWIFFLSYSGVIAFLNRKLPRTRDTIVLLCVCSLLVPLYTAKYFSQHSFSPVAFFGGDTWEYQSMGVNFAYGHGVHRFGGIEPFERYRFSHDAENQTYYQTFLDYGREGGRLNLYRTPAYPLFVGLVYKLYGVSPQKLKYVQLYLVVLSASFLPYLGFRYGGWSLALGGTIAGYLFAETWSYELARHVLTEALISFVVFVTLLGYSLYDEKPTGMRAFLFGALLGCNPLTKGSLIFAPPLFLLLIGFRGFPDSRKKNLRIWYDSSITTLWRNKRPVLFAAIGFLIISGSWSVFASVNVGSFVAFSTQTAAVLLETNNECMVDGGWHPDPECKQFYSREEVKGLSPLRKVIAFYWTHPEMITEIFTSKINRGFDKFGWFKLTLLLAIVQMGLFTARRMLASRGIEYIEVLLGVASAVVMAAMAFYGWGNVTAVSIVLRDLISISSSTLLIAAIVTAVCSFALTKQWPLAAPAPVVIYLVDIILVTTITFGSVRYIEIIDFLFVLLSCHYLFLFSRLWTARASWPRKAPRDRE